jgi:hypothetical protein
LANTATSATRNFSTIPAKQTSMMQALSLQNSPQPLSSHWRDRHMVSLQKAFSFWPLHPITVL